MRIGIGRRVRVRVLESWAILSVVTALGAPKAHSQTTPPSNLNPMPSPGENRWLTDYGSTSHARVDVGGGKKRTHLHTIARPSGTIALLDAGQCIIAENGTNDLGEPQWTIWRHSSGLNVLWYDSHVTHQAGLFPSGWNIEPWEFQ